MVEGNIFSFVSSHLGGGGVPQSQILFPGAWSQVLSGSTPDLTREVAQSKVLSQGLWPQVLSRGVPQNWLGGWEIPQSQVLSHISDPRSFPGGYSRTEVPPNQDWGTLPQPGLGYPPPSRTGYAAGGKSRVVPARGLSCCRNNLRFINMCRGMYNLIWCAWRGLQPNLLYWKPLPEAIILSDGMTAVTTSDTQPICTPLCTRPELEEIFVQK